ncbi:type II toxin-antitoxin system Phd/YefM family antitoxin [Thauera sp. SDU_THAU2]|uniref:type II toxin-antitoxin system Phd/YefM family antitoxin n=1 Tax=Thauera sp. SDU_THAU2 TaxID=3136633 RepID=UPI00311F58A1
MTINLTMVMVIHFPPGELSMQTIQASEFKARCLAIMDQVAESGEIIVVTKNGKPVAELHPYAGENRSSPFGLHPGLRIQGDIMSPLAADDWEALA